MNLTTEDVEVKDERAAWVEGRRRYIGGSDAPVIAGFSRWKTQAELWYEKKGLIEAPDLSDREAVHFGNVLEDVVASEFCRRTGRKVQRVNRILTHPDRPWMAANLDRRVVGEQALLECKTTNQFTFSTAWNDGVPEDYTVQVQHYLAVTGFDVAYVAVLIGGQRFEHYEVWRDDELIEALITLEEDFWQSLQNDEPPAVDYEHPTALELMKRRYPGTNGRAVKLAARAAELREEEEALARVISEAQARRDSIRAELLGMIGEHAVGILPDGSGWTRRQVDEKEIRYVRKAYVDFRFSKKVKVED